jgi:hypothetical protein
MQRTQYLNAKNTFDELLNMGVIPIVNENDTLAVAVSVLPTSVNFCQFLLAYLRAYF